MNKFEIYNSLNDTSCNTFQCVWTQKKKKKNLPWSGGNRAYHILCKIKMSNRNIEKNCSKTSMTSSNEYF